MFNDFLSLLFPHTCEICHRSLAKGEQMLCAGCISDLPLVDNTFLEQVVNRYFIYPERYKGFYSYLKYYKKGITQQILHKIKYRHRPVLGEILGYWLGLEIRSLEKNVYFDLIIPLPLHPVKRRKRGFNQSDYIAKGLSGALNITWTDKYVMRKVNNVTQTNKSRMDRLKNVEGIFSVVDHQAIRDCHILLVDDVITTGATMESCAGELIEAGAAGLSLASLAIAEE